MADHCIAVIIELISYFYPLKDQESCPPRRTRKKGLKQRPPRIRAIPVCSRVGDDRLRSIRKEKGDAERKEAILWELMVV
ncbi:hypothetical protein MUK42_35747 [Musa troglodytarum]|uniref:Uncharacterized protein n=1 Tax=Musa troglodytarum TaxID=320322 RepID=A0A9E7EDM2_9LILI|nr:hypothetical protein MUK42_35747 [Musa troglodytarum]